LGLTAVQPTSWTGHGDALHRPEAVVLFAFDNAPSTLVADWSTAQGRMYALSSEANDEQSPLTANELVEKIENDFPSSTVIDVHSQTYIETFGAKSFDQMTNSEEESTTTNSELDIFERLHKWLNTEASRTIDNKSPDLFIVHIRSLDTVDNLDETVKMIDEYMKKLTADFRRVYADNVVIARVASEHKNVRVKRQAIRQASAASPPMPSSMYVFVDGNYPFKFSIVLFTSVGLALVLLFITVAMWTMEPGKDTIIYRMTQTKKKDL